MSEWEKAGTLGVSDDAAQGKPQPSKPRPIQVEEIQTPAQPSKKRGRRKTAVAPADDGEAGVEPASPGVGHTRGKQQKRSSGVGGIAVTSEVQVGRVLGVQTAETVETAETAEVAETAEAAEAVDTMETAEMVELAETAEMVELAETADMVELAETTEMVELAESAAAAAATAAAWSADRRELARLQSKLEIAPVIPATRKGMLEGFTEAQLREMLADGGILTASQALAAADILSGNGRSSTLPTSDVVDPFFEKLSDAERTRHHELITGFLYYETEDYANGNGGINARDRAGQTALHRAVVEDDAVAVAKLLNAGANVDAVDNAGHTPLHSAADEAVVQVLLTAGAEPLHACATDGNTPMHEAARHDNREMLLLLLRAGGSKVLANKAGETPAGLYQAAGGTPSLSLVLHHDPGHRITAPDLSTPTSV